MNDNFIMKVKFSEIEIITYFQAFTKIIFVNIVK